MSAACYSRAMLYEKPEKYKDAKADLRKAAGLGDTDARARIEKINDEQRGKEQ